MVLNKETKPDQYLLPSKILFWRWIFSFGKRNNQSSYTYSIYRRLLFQNPVISKKKQNKPFRLKSLEIGFLFFFKLALTRQNEVQTLSCSTISLKEATSHQVTGSVQCSSIAA